MTAVHVPLPVQGALDTSGTPSTRAPGTLLEAIDVDLRSWAARRGFTQRTWVYRAPAGSFPNPQTVVFDGTNGYGTVAMGSTRQFNLGTRWTFDLVFRPTSVTHSSDATVPLFQWWLNGIEAFGIYLKAGGAASGDRAKLVAVVTPTSSPGVAGTPVTLTGVTQLSLGATLTKTHHVRLQRVGAALTIVADGVAEASSTSFSATQRHEMLTGSTATAYVGAANGLATGANHLFNGRVFRALLRSGAASDVTKGMRDFSFQGGSGAHFVLHGKCLTTLGQFERSPFQAPLTWSGTSFEDVTEPAPWYSSGVQGGAYFVDKLGRAWNCVIAGGTLYAKRVG